MRPLFTFCRCRSMTPRKMVAWNNEKPSSQRDREAVVCLVLRLLSVFLSFFDLMASLSRPLLCQTLKRALPRPLLTNTACDVSLPKQRAISRAAHYHIRLYIQQTRSAFFETCTYIISQLMAQPNASYLVAKRGPLSACRVSHPLKPHSNSPLPPSPQKLAFSHFSFSYCKKQNTRLGRRAVRALA